MIGGALQDTQTGWPGHLGGIPTKELLLACPPLVGAGRALGPLQTPAFAGGGPSTKQEEVRTKEVSAFPPSPLVLKMTKLSSEGAQLHPKGLRLTQRTPARALLLPPSAPLPDTEDPPHPPLPGWKGASPVPRGKSRLDMCSWEQKGYDCCGPVASMETKLLIGKPFISTSPSDVVNEHLAAGSSLLC